MATRTPVLEFFYSGSANVVRVTWTALANGDSGLPVELADYPDKTVQVTGTFGTGGSINIEGSNYGLSETPVYAILTDPQGNAITKTAAAMETVEEGPSLIRPNVTAGDGDTALQVRIIARRPRV